MLRNNQLTAILISITVIGASFADDTVWPQFRGWSGVLDSQTIGNDNIPLEFNLETRQNVAWQADLPGRGPSSPVISGGRVFVTASGGREQSELYTLAFDINSGEKLWQRTLYATGRTLTHSTSANAAPTPATNGDVVIAFYSSNDVACFDLDGTLRWYRGLAADYPKLGNDIGMAASPIIVDDIVIVQAESQGDSFALGLDIKTGENVWKIARKRQGNWTSPAVYRDDKDDWLVLLQSGEILSAHDPITGEEQWRYEAEIQRIPSPLAAGNQIFIPAEGLTALTIADGEPNFDWQKGKLSPGSSSPIHHQGRVYIVKRNGILSCADTKDGKLAWEQRLKTGSQWATPAIAGGHIFCFGTNGKVAIVDLEDGEIVSSPDLGETLTASPAIANDAIYMRSDAHLWKFAKTTN